MAKAKAKHPVYAMPFGVAKAAYIELQKAVAVAEEPMKKYPITNPRNGSRRPAEGSPTFDAWKADYRAMWAAKDALSLFHFHYVRHFKEEIAADKMAERGEKPRHCQYCERQHKVVMSAKGVELIAHHGYQRPGGGWQTASCVCARELPYEKSCEALPPIIQDFKETIERISHHMEEVKEEPPKGIRTSATVRFGKGYRAEEVYVSRTVLRPADFDKTKKLDWTDRQDPQNNYAVVYHADIAEMQAEIAWRKSEIERLTARVRNWKLQP